MHMILILWRNVIVETRCVLDGAYEDEKWRCKFLRAYVNDERKERDRWMNIGWE